MKFKASKKENDKIKSQIMCSECDENKTLLMAEIIK